jgi:hypothetical protein
MSPSKLGLFASLALAANAVLIPPSMTAAELGDDNALETLAINPFKRVVAVECPGCPVATLDDKSLTWEKDAGNAFVSFPMLASGSLAAIPRLCEPPHIHATSSMRWLRAQTLLTKVAP